MKSQEIIIIRKELLVEIVRLVGGQVLHDLYELSRWFWKDPMVVGNTEEKEQWLKKLNLGNRVEELQNGSYNFFDIKELVEELYTQVNENGKEIADDDVLDYFMWVTAVVDGMRVVFGVLNSYEDEEGEYLLEELVNMGWKF